MKQIVADRNSVEKRVKRRAKLFRGLADPSRLEIVQALCDRPLVVHELVERTGLTQPNVSNHLRCLSECGLVASERDGRFVRYRISSQQMADLLREADTLLDTVADGVDECRNYRLNEIGP